MRHAVQYLTWLLSLALAATHAVAIGADADLSRGMPFLNVFTPSDYGAHDQNWAVIQHPNGLIYVGNNHGVLEYDGVRWRRIELPQRQSARRFLLLDDGTLLVGADGGLHQLQADRSGRMQQQDLSADVFGEGVRPSQVLSLTRLDDAVWLATSDGAYRLQYGQARHWPLPDTTRLAIVGADVVLHQSEAGILRLVDEEFITVPELVSFADQALAEVQGLDNGDWLLPSRSNGLFRFQPQSGVLSRVGGGNEPDALDTELASAVILRTMRIDAGLIAIGTTRQGLFLINDRGELQQRVGSEQGLLDASVSDIAVDAEDGLWLTSNYGITRVDINAPLRRWDDSLGIRGTLVHMNYTHGGELLIGSTQGLIRMAAGRFRLDTRIGAQVWRINKLPDSDNEILVTTHDNTWLLDLDENQAARSIGPGGYLNLPLSGSPRSVLIGLNAGLIRLLETAEGWQQDVISDYQATARSLAWDGAGRLWVGTLSRGVLRLSWPDDPERMGLPEVEFFGAEHGLPETHYVEVHSLSDRTVFGTSAACGASMKPGSGFCPKTISETF